MLKRMKGASGEVLLIDRSTRRAFRAKYTDVMVNGGKRLDLERVPEYYRHEAPKICAWFLLTEIWNAKYDEELAFRFGEYTLLTLGESPRRSPSTKPHLPEEVGGTALLHLSDVHFGADYGFCPQRAKVLPGARCSKTLTECIIADLERLSLRESIGLVVVSGDLTTGGDWSDQTTAQILEEFAALRKALGIGRRQIIVLPGNHDVVRYPNAVGSTDISTFNVHNQTTFKHEQEFRVFQRELTGGAYVQGLNYSHRFSFDTIDLDLCVLNSCAIAAVNDWTEYGYVGDLGVGAIKTLTEFPINRPTIRMMAVHHHLIPVVRVETAAAKGVSVTLDAIELLDAAQEAGVQVVIHGHQHVPRVVFYEHFKEPFNSANSDELNGITIVSGGSVSSKQLPGANRNTYSLFRFDPSGVRLTLRELRTDAVSGMCLFEGKLRVRPLAP
jgi:3',5'-cyclic AMP phosphodiesterase CpdA